MESSTKNGSQKPVTGWDRHRDMILHRDTGSNDRAYALHDVGYRPRGRGYFNRTYSDVIDHCRNLTRINAEE
jgi:hypothetical protein